MRRKIQQSAMMSPMMTMTRTMRPARPSESRPPPPRYPPPRSPMPRGIHLKGTRSPRMNTFQEPKTEASHPTTEADPVAKAPTIQCSRSMTKTSRHVGTDMPLATKPARKTTTTRTSTLANSEKNREEMIRETRRRSAPSAVPKRYSYLHTSQRHCERLLALMLRHVSRQPTCTRDMDPRQRQGRKRRSDPEPSESSWQMRQMAARGLSYA
mmetsp:Transcript_18204/g.48970  ORF Transcript_18204/g.48970 Transcript_18204/m.48970 type:complete len:211 (-) Transcript_18204:56-688(-)